MRKLYCIPAPFHVDRTSCGASDTTAIGLTYAMYFIASDRRVWKRLSSEIREQFNSVDEITGQSTEFLTFLVAVICEGVN